MSLKINNDTANGSVTIQANNTATGDVVATLPPFSTELAPRMQLMTAKTASGTSVDFTGIPSWAKKITVMFTGVSTTGTSVVQVQLGSGSVTTTDYYGTNLNATGSGVAVSAINNGAGFVTDNAGAATYTRHGSMVFTLLTGNTWSMMGNMGYSESARANFQAGSIALSGALDRIRVTTINGTDVFDAGQINILVEG